MSHLTTNQLTIDEERKLAHRSELKRRLAEISVKRTRISELKNIVEKLNADSDRAAEQHGVEAGKLQAELDGMDEEQIQCVLQGKSSPETSIARRVQILDELSKLNQILETTCEANKRAARPIRKQIEELLSATADETVLRNRLSSLCSPELRRQRLLNSHKLQWSNVMLKEAQRMIEILNANVTIAKSNKDSSTESIKAVRAEDWKTVVDSLQSEIAAIHRNDTAIEAAAMAE